MDDVMPDCLEATERWRIAAQRDRRHHISRAKRLEHQVIVHCKINPGIRIIDAMAVVFNDERARLGIQIKTD